MISTWNSLMVREIRDIWMACNSSHGSFWSWHNWHKAWEWPNFASKTRQTMWNRHFNSRPKQRHFKYSSGKTSYLTWCCLTWISWLVHIECLWGLYFKSWGCVKDIPLDWLLASHDWYLSLWAMTRAYYLSWQSVWLFHYKRI